MYRKKISKKQNKGITLIALVITIIVLLILAGVTIVMLMGSDNAPQKASEAAQKDAISGAKDAITMEVSKSLMDNYNGPNAEKKDIQKLVQDAAKTAVETTRKNNKFLIDPTGVDGNIITLQTESYCVTGKIDEQGAIMWSDAVASTAKPLETTNMYAVLYTDGTLAFSQTDKKIEGKEVKSDYGNIKDKVYTVEKDSSGVSTANTPWYSEKESIKIVNFVDEIIPISTSAMFFDCKNITEIQNIQNLNTEKVTDMSFMFCNCITLKSLDVSNFDTSHVTNMDSMFAGGFENKMSLTEIIGLDRFDTKNVTNMRSMFQNCEKISNIDVSHFDTKNVTDMNRMFFTCRKLESIDVSNFDTSHVTDMYAMFCSCQTLKSIDVSSFNTSQVTDMNFIFAGNSSDIMSLTEIIGLEKFDTSNVKIMGVMFQNCNKISSLDLSSFNTKQVTDMNYMFANCSTLKTIYVGDGWTTQNATTDYMFSGCGTSTVTKKGQ